MLARIGKWFDFGFDAPACWSTDPSRRVSYGTHKIICVRGFEGSMEATDYAMDEVEKLQRNTSGKLPTKIDYQGAHGHYDWRSISDAKLKKELARCTGANEDQFIIKQR